MAERCCFKVGVVTIPSAVLIVKTVAGSSLAPVASLPPARRHTEKLEFVRARAHWQLRCRAGRVDGANSSSAHCETTDSAATSCP